MVTGRMATEDDFGAGGFFEAQALRTDGDPAIGADFYGGAEAPNKGPPRAAGGWAQDRALGPAGAVPGLLRGHAQFAMGFGGVVMQPQLVDVGVGFLDLRDVFAGEIGREAALPELVLALDFPLGLWRWGIQETNVVEFERGPKLREGVGILGEKDTMIIDIKLQRAAIGLESGGQKIKVGEQPFPVIDFGTHEHAAAIIEHIEHGKIQNTGGEPVMRRSIQLPEFADLGALPAPHWRMRLVHRGGVSQAVLQGPMADLGAVQLKGMQAQSFGGRKAVRAGGCAGQPFFKEVGDGHGPGGGMVTARSAWGPQGFRGLRDRAEASRGERIETAARQPQLFSGLGRRQGLLLKGGQHMTDESRGVAIR